HYLADDYFPGATPLDYALIGGLEFGAALFISPACTVLTRDLGRNAVMFAGCTMLSGGFIAASFATQIWHLYLSQGVLIGMGIGAIFIPSVQVLPQWFLKRRSLAGGLASAGSGFGGLAFSLGTNAMIEQISLAWSLRITGIIGFVANFIGMVLVKDRNHVVKPPQLGFAIHLLRRYDCLLLLSWAFVNLLGYMVILYSLSSYAVQVVGLTQAQAGVITAVLNLGTGIGRPLIGLASDRFGRIEVAATLTLTCGLLLVAIWIPANNYGVLIFYAIPSGAMLGVFWMTIGPLCAEVAGLREVPSFLSLQWLTAVLPTTFSEVIALYLRKPEKGRWAYLYAQIFAALAYIVASMFLFELLRLKRRGRLMSQMPEIAETSSGSLGHVEACAPLPLNGEARRHPERFDILTAGEKHSCIYTWPESEENQPETPKVPRPITNSDNNDEMRSSTLLPLVAASLPLALAQEDSLTSSKRGLCYVDPQENTQDTDIWDASDSDLTWYYNYEASPTDGIDESKLQFVPMIWGLPDSTSSMAFYNTVKGLMQQGYNITYVLGFNEPDGCVSGGSCIAAEDAAAAWIREIEPLKDEGVLLGAPAVTGSPMGFTWLENFYNACNGNCTTHFIPVHWYGNFEGLASHMGQVNGTYPNMTMWVTEYACADCELEEAQQFYNQSADYFDRLDYVTHYSYFGAFRSDVSNVGKNAAMLTQKGELTDIGAWYLGQEATGNKPKGGAAQVAKFAGWAVVVASVAFWTVL
ncbi:glycoside hydrolase family 128 protein, partial [Hortaea werneckii]